MRTETFATRDACVVHGPLNAGALTKFKAVTRNITGELREWRESVTLADRRRMKNKKARKRLGKLMANRAARSW